MSKVIDNIEDTDWKIVKAQELGTEVETQVLADRAQARADINTAEQTIQG